MPFSPWIPKISKTIGFKIAAGYFLLFSCSLILLAVFAYLLLETTLTRQDRSRIADEVAMLQERYEAGGWTAFHETILENDRFRKNNPFFTRARQGKDGREINFFPQYWDDFDLSALEEISLSAAGKWMTLPNRAQSYALEIFTARQPDGGLFQVGISTEDRLTALARYEESFAAVAIPLALLAVVGGAFLSRRVLRPLRDLIDTVASIEAGKMDARVHVSHSGDELDELGGLFNRMIEKINLLIQGMKGSLDSVAHDLRTPMTRFRNIAETALQQEQNPSSYREALQECLDESDRILRMLHILMDISEAEAGTMRLQIRPVDMVELAERVVDMYRYVGEEKNIRIETEFPGSAPLEADADRMCLVLANLIDNAVKFTAPEGAVRVAIRNLPGRVQVQVADTGIGIPSEEIGKIWDRLYRGSHGTPKGLGLGLSMVKAVVHAHRGEVQVSSTQGLGSIFTTLVPDRHHP